MKVSPWERPRREGLVEGEKPCTGCGVVKPHTFNSATSGFYVYLRDGIIMGWEGRCADCRNLHRAQRWNESRGLGGHRVRTPRMTREERNARRRERHNRRMATDPEYVRKQYEARPRLHRVERIPSGPLADVLRRVRIARGESQVEFAQTLEVKEAWLADVLSEKVETVELATADRILTFLDWDSRLEQLYPELRTA